MINHKKVINKNNSNSGITLIALVVTIIVLLLLAGISISMLTGENGILQRAIQSKEKTGRAEIIENAKLDIQEKISEKKGENLTAAELEEILISPDYSTQGILSSEENILERTLTSKDEQYEIPVYEIYSGYLKTSQSYIPKTISFNIYYEGDYVNYTAIEGQTWYEWAVTTKDEDSSRCLSTEWGDSLQNVIISFYNQDPSKEIYSGWDNENYWKFTDSTDAIQHVDDVIVENEYYHESSSWGM